MNSIECTVNIFANETGLLYLDKISDKLSKGTKAIDVFQMKTNFSFSSSNYTRINSTH